MGLNQTFESAPGFSKYPDYTIDMIRAERPIKAVLQGQIIADSRNALILHESNHIAVVYFPREDVRMDLAIESDKNSFCPFKGTASYFGFGEEANIAWSYENPFLETAEIKGYLAFYTDRLDHPLLS